MAELTIATTYGSALFQAASEAGKEDLILEESEQVLEIFKQEPDFYDFFNYPGISAKEKKEVLKNVFESFSNKSLLNPSFTVSDVTGLYVSTYSFGIY